MSVDDRERIVGNWLVLSAFEVFSHEGPQVGVVDDTWREFQSSLSERMKNGVEKAIPVRQISDSLMAPLSQLNVEPPRIVLARGLTLL